MEIFRKISYSIFMAFIRYIYNWIIIFLITITFVREKMWDIKR